MIKIEQAIEDLNKSEIVEFDKDGNMVEEGKESIALTSGELIILLKRLQELEKKAIPLKPIEPIQIYYGCPICRGKLYENQLFCERCGQAIKWDFRKEK